jgi:regulator of nucleoside diphosphate kinase
MTRRGIYFTTHDVDRLSSLIKGFRTVQNLREKRLDLLEKELEKGIVVNPVDLPKDVITMNSRFSVTDAESNETTTYTLVYPSAADISENKLSILAPLGMALIGRRAGDIVKWIVASGAKKAKIDKIIYQPDIPNNQEL